MEYLIPGDLVHIKNFEYDGSGNLIYIGYALPNSADADSKWMIKKATYDASNNILTEKFAGGNANLDKQWTLRASYSYS
jgi:hypothetical protein